ncbi:sugar ABC transporter substrate-binding protein [Bombiscardovia nodaiensis]|uniref:Sugar ABC transporter substrate-binding protein n=1 Tax=Bombiscardovia nodaiensis TaxID=2932181 RepID=A0ABN6S9R5_9BIFI|nr:sugar ABC transporter substrate-binding protein [Bombiscardovia nodaiensis]
MPGVMKKAVTAGIALAAVLSMSACGGSGNGDSNKSSDDKKEITLTFSDDQNNAYKTMAEKYTKDKGVKVNIMEVPYSDLSTKIANAAKANDLPDVARVPQVNPVWTDQLEDLSDIAQKHDAMKDFLVKDSDGKMTTIASDLTSVGLMINTTLFDKAGVSYPKPADKPWTWDEFIEAITKVQDATGAKYGMVMDASTHRERSFMYQFGSKGVQQQKDKTWKLDSQAKTALEFLKKIDNDKTMPKSIWASNEDPSALFKSGQVAAYYSGNWQIADFINSISAFQWKTVPMPAQPTVATNVGTNYMVALSPAGKKFLDWYYSKDNYTQFCEKGSYLPALNGITPHYAQRNEDMQLYQDIIKNAPAETRSHQVVTQLQLAIKGAVLPKDDPMKQETVKYLSGEEDADAALKNMGDLFTKYYNSEQ